MSLYECACMSCAELRRSAAAEMAFSGVLLATFMSLSKLFCGFDKCSKKTFLQTWML